LGLVLASCADGPGPGDLQETQDASAPRVEPGRAVSPLDGVVSVQISRAGLSLPLRDAVAEGPTAPHGAHPALKIPDATWPQLSFVDRTLQPDIGPFAMPPPGVDFLAQGTTLEGCNFSTNPPSPPGCTTTGAPPDPNGAVGLNHYVQLVNGGIGIWNKSGGVVQAPKFINTLWAGYTCTNAGCACATQNDGDPIVIYDQLADRWFVSQFSLPNGNKAPSFQCVAVSQTPDPTGAYYLYDYQYNYITNDYAKFGLWPDAYYATFNMFNRNFVAADLCAYDRASMLAGKPATQQCVLESSGWGVLPVSLEGPIHPPLGETGFFLQLGQTASGNFTGNTLQMWKMHVDWATPANTTMTGPTSIPIAACTEVCNGGVCIPEPAPGNKLDSLGDRLMFHLGYRNFGDHESLVVSHSVAAGAQGGSRWYEIRSPAGTPTVFQQGTYAPADGAWRWLGSISQDQAQDFALGFSLSSTTRDPAIAWTGRLGTDAPNVMTQGEAVIHAGTGVQTGSQADRWGDYSNMTIDPSDDCTFWYTNEVYPSNGQFNWDTYVASVKFPTCAQNDFGISVSPALQTVADGGSVDYTVSTTLKAGTAETVVLYIQDLPTGVSAGFSPPSVTAGGTSTLTLTASASAPATGSPAPTFTVIGHATSAVHAATAQVAVTTCGTTGLACCTGNVCAAGDVCSGGTCVACGATTEPCCAGSTCNAGDVCSGGTCLACGATGEPCCAGNACGSGNVCSGGSCTACGAASQPCCTGNACNAGDVCVAGNCAACGAAGEPCCSGSTCNAGEVCLAGTCGTCGAAGQPCCTGGMCAAPDTCGGGGTAGVCGCTPATSCPGGDDCGTVPNGCGGTVACGSCTGQSTCVGNTCVCQPSTCGSLGATCGSPPDGCGGTLSCGSCSGQSVCTAFRCVCQPLTSCPAGACGSIPDGCGGTLACGACTGAQQACVGNTCVCQPATCGSLGLQCGTASDGCGASLSCGSCASSQQTCVSNHCVCQPITTCPAASCGQVPDGCGGTLACGSCSGGLVCTGNQCVMPEGGAGDGGSTMDASTTDGGTPDSGGGDAGAMDGGAGDGGGHDGGGHDAGSHDAGADGGHATDAGSTDGATSADAAQNDAAADAVADAEGDGAAEGGAGATPGQNGGCGCRTAGAEHQSGALPLLGLGGLAFVGWRRLRRRAPADGR